jgi:hypothetical protein
VANGSFCLSICLVSIFDYVMLMSRLMYAVPSRYVPHDVEELVKLYGGGDAFAEKLNTFFDGGHYNHGKSLCHNLYG